MSTTIPQTTAETDKGIIEKVKAFVEEHLVKIAFAISTLVLAILSPLSFYFFSAAGALIHSYFQPDLKVDKETSIVPVHYALAAVIGAIAEVLKFTPAGSAGGLIFKLISPLASMAVGSFGYQSFHRHCKSEGV